MPVEVVETSRLRGLPEEGAVCVARLRGQDRGVLATSKGKVLIFDWNDGVVVRQLRGVFANTTQLLSVQNSSLIAVVSSGKCSIFDSRNGDLVYLFQTRSARQVQYQICSPTCIAFILGSKDKIRVASIQDAHCYSLVSTKTIQLPFTLSQFCVSDDYNETVVCHDEHNQALFLVNYTSGHVAKIRECLFPKLSFFSRTAPEEIRTIASYRKHYAALTGRRLILGKRGTQFQEVKLPQAPVAASSIGPILYILTDSQIEARDIFSGKVLVKNSLPPKTQGMSGAILWSDSKVFDIETKISDSEFSKLASESTADALMVASSGVAATDSVLVQDFVKSQVVTLLNCDDLAAAMDILEAIDIPLQSWAKSLWDYLKRYRESQAMEPQMDDTVSLVSTDLAPDLRETFQRLEGFLLRLRDRLSREKNTGSGGELVDTSLLASYMTRNSPALKAFLRLPNKCKEEDVERLLKQHNHLDLLVVFYSSRGLYQKALALIHDTSGIAGVKGYLPACPMNSLKQALKDYRNELTASDFRQILESATQHGPDELINEGVQVLLESEPSEAESFCQAMKQKYSSLVAFWYCLATIALKTDNAQLLKKCLSSSDDSSMSQIADLAVASTNEDIKLLGLAYLGRFKELLAVYPQLSLKKAIDYIQISARPQLQESASLLTQLMQTELKTDFDGTLKLLCDNSDLFVLERFLDSCNDTVELDRVLPFLVAKVRSSITLSSSAQGSAALATVSKKQLKHSLMAQSKASWLLTEQSFCSRCHRSLGLGKLSMFPDGSVAHFGCSK